ncbi:hypothetical protein BGZ98_007360 [Dissophora globulifera]|nr:hypothetical protein BGZ98_007360 [Dissophora globulifera]
MSPLSPTLPSSKGTGFGSFLAMTGIAALAFLGTSLTPPASAAIAFGAAVDSPGSIIQGGLSSMVPKPVSLIDKYLVPGLLNLTYAGVNITSPTQVVISANASLLNPFGSITLPIGVVGLSVWLDGMSLANVTTSDLTLAAGIGPLNVTATVNIADGSSSPALQTSLNNLVTSFFGGVTPSGAPPKLVINNISVGGYPLALDPVTIPTQITPTGPIQPSSVPGTSSQPSVIGFGGMINPAINWTLPTLNKVIFKAVTGAQLTAGVGFSWNNPLNLALDIPYISIDLGLNGTRVVTIAVDALHLAAGNMSAETSVDLKFNNDPQAAVQLGAFVNDFLAGTLHQVVSVGNFTFGTKDSNTPTGILLNNLFSGLGVDLPLMNVSTVAIEQLVLGYIAPYLPIDISKLGSASGSTLMTYIQGLALSTTPGHTLLIEPKIRLPLPFELDLNIPYFALDINLDNSNLGQLFLANLVGTGSGEVDISVGIGIVFREPAPEIPPTIAKLVNGLMTGNGLDIVAGISNLAIGISPSDAVNTLNTLNFGVPISDIITGSINTGSLLGDVMSHTNITLVSNAISIKVGSLAQLTIHEAAIAVLPNNMVTAGINLDMFLGLPVVANIGYLGLQVTLDGSNLAGVGLTSGLNYGGGTVQMNAGVAISVGTGSAISSKVAALVSAIAADQTVTSSIGISGIVIGQSSDDLINALSQVSVSLPLGSLLGGGGFLSGLLTQLGLSVSEFSLATIPNAGLQAGATAKFSNPIPISLSVPFIGVSGGLDNVDIVNVGLENLAMAPGVNSLKALVDLNFNNALNAQTKVATFAGELLGGQLGNTTESLTVHDLRIGASPSDYFDLLSQIYISIPSRDLLNKANVDFVMGQLGLNSTQLTSSLLSNVHIGAVSLNLNNAPVMELGTSISVSNISLNAAVNIGYFGIDLALDSHALAHVDVPSVTIATVNNLLTLTVKAFVTIQDTPEVQTDIGNLVNFFMANSTVSPVNSLVISKPLVGVSTSDNIQTFALLQYPIGLPSLLLQVKAYVAQMLAGLGGLNMNSLAVSGLVVDMNSPSIINIQGGVQVKNLTLPADISISYVGVSLGLDTTPLAGVTIPTLAFTSANGSLSVNFQALVDINQGQDLSTQIAHLIGAVLHPGQVTPPTNVVIYDPVFGGDKNHLFHILSQVKVNVALAPYLQQVDTLLKGAVAGSIGISNLVVDLNSPQVIGIDAGVLIKNVGLPADIKLNYIGTNVAINSIPLAQVDIPKFTLAPQGADLALQVHVDVSLLESPGLTNVISSVISGILSNQTLPETDLVISGTKFGASSSNFFTLLQDVVVPINVSSIISKIGGMFNGAGSLLNGLGLSGLAINLNQAPTISIDANIAVHNVSLPAQLNLGYFGLNVGIDNVPLVQVGIPKIQLGSSGGDLTIGTHIDARLSETDASQSLVAALVNAVVAGQVPPGTIVISGIAFGPSSNNVYTFLQGVQIPIPISKILSLVPSTGSTDAGSLLSKLSLESADINMKNPPSIGADIAIALLGFQFDAQLLLNYVSINAFLDQTPLATISVPGITLSSGNNQVDLKVHSLVNLASGGDIQSKVAAIAAQVMGGSGSQNANLVVSNIAFGGGTSNVFHILDKVQVSLPLAPYIQKLTGLFGSATGGNSTAAPVFSIDQVDISAPGANDLSIAVGASIGGIGSKISVEMPYIGLQVSAGGSGFVYPMINNFQLSNGKVALTLDLPFQPAARQIIGSLSGPISQLLFSTVGTVPGSVVINSIEFGASPSQAFDIAAKISLELQLNSVFQAAQAFLNRNPLHLNDMNTVLTTTGIQATISLPGFPLPLKMNFPVALSAFYQGQAFLSIQATSLSLGQSPWALGAGIQVIQPEFSSALNGILPNVLEWKNALQDVTAGGITLGSFTALSSLIITPPSITLWSPINIPTNQLKVHLVPLSLDMAVEFTNNGPLQVDVGTVDIMIMDGDINVIEIQSLGGPIHINNGNQNGGNNLITLNSALKFNFLQFFQIIASLLNPTSFHFVFSMRTSSGQPMPWLQDALNGIPDSIFRNLLPILGKVLGNVKFTL